MEFNIINEENKFKLGSIIAIFKIPESDKKIALFSIEDLDTLDTDRASLNVAFVESNSEGYDYLSEIKDKEIKKKAIESAKDIISMINSNPKSK